MDLPGRARGNAKRSRASDLVRLVSRCTVASLARSFVLPAAAVRLTLLARFASAAPAASSGNASGGTVKVALDDCHDTLEWLLPSPPDFHTYAELPFIKESDGAGPGAKH